jgi:uncharacterized integral membrane protein
MSFFIINLFYILEDSFYIRQFRKNYKKNENYKNVKALNIKWQLLHLGILTGAVALLVFIVQNILMNLLGHIVRISMIAVVIVLLVKVIFGIFIIIHLKS